MVHSFPSLQSTPEVQSFVQRYRTRWNNETPEGVSALGYDAMNLLAAALRRNGTVDSRKLRDAIAATRDFEGVTGRTTIDEKRNSTKAAVMLTIKDGRTRFFEAVAP